jgi:hypothetical protein
MVDILEYDWRVVGNFVGDSAVGRVVVEAFVGDMLVGKIVRIEEVVFGSFVVGMRV